MTLTNFIGYLLERHCPESEFPFSWQTGLEVPPSLNRDGSYTQQYNGFRNILIHICLCEFYLTN
jgi:hypothetical protein